MLYFAAKLGAGAFLFTRRESYEAVGGFDEQFFAGEEVYFSMALKKFGPIQNFAGAGRDLRAQDSHALAAVRSGTVALHYLRRAMGAAETRAARTLVRRPTGEQPV